MGFLKFCLYAKYMRVNFGCFYVVVPQSHLAIPNVSPRCIKCMAKLCLSVCSVSIIAPNDISLRPAFDRCFVLVIKVVLSHFLAFQRRLGSPRFEECRREKL